MSVNITVNGKFSKQSLLNDPEGYKKQLEHERRKLRLQQVREQSKELARKIRTDVSEEKERQLRNLEAVKAQELNLWRKTVVAQKSVDYRNALDQVGSAHLAARKEKAAEKEKKIAREKELAREKERGRAAITKELQSPRRSPTNQKPQTKRPQREERPEKRQKRVSYKVVAPKGTKGHDDGEKRERINVLFDEKFESCSCSIDTDSGDQWSTDEIIETCDLLGFSTSSLSGMDISSQKDSKSTQTAASKETILKRAPPVLLQVNVDPIESEVIVAPAHVVDKHVETNRQFDSVVSMEPERETAATQTDNIVSTVPVDEESAPRPRYTQISDLLAKQKSAGLITAQEGLENVSPEQLSNVTTSASYIVERSAPLSTVASHSAEIVAPAASLASVIPERTAPTATADKTVPAVVVTEKTATSATVSSTTPQGASALKVTRSLPTNRATTMQRKTVPPYPTRQSRASRISTTSGATTTSSKDTGDRSEGGGSFVQFYDYNNKYTKEYSHPLDAVAVPQREKDEPNAMQQAALENRRLNGRDRHTEKLRQKSEERGKVALEREKVRRDCVDLTEKLDALTQKGQPVLPKNVNLHGRAYFAEKVARKEAKMNSAIEELLSRPAIITCPEVRREVPKTSHSLRSKSTRPLDSSDLNLGSRLCSGESDNVQSKSTDTEDSGSILLGYIDDQRDQIRNELSQCDDSPARNNEKKEKLTQLLGRIEALRESLLKELQKDAEKESGPIGDAQISKGQQEPYEGSTMTFKKKKDSQVDSQTQSALDERERALKEREIMLQKELAKVIQTQKNLKNDQGGSGVSGGNTAKSTAIKIVAGKEQIIERTSRDKPLEIVIKVKGERKSSKRKSKPIQNKDTVQQEKLPTPTVQPINSNESAAANRRGSYDSNSTAYQSMPSALAAATEQFVDRMQQLEGDKKQQLPSAESSRSSSNGSAEQQRVETRKHPKSQLNPLIAQYVQRLLGMSRDSVMALEVSSSDVDTPSSSVINITTNLASSSGQGSMLSEDHLQRVERFVNENRSFIAELEESIRTHSNAPLETSIRHFEEIWKQKFKQKAPKETTKPTAAVSRESKSKPEKEKPKKVVQETTPRVTQPAAAQKPEKFSQKKVQVKDMKVTKTTARVANKDKTEERELQTTDAHLTQYAELTKNCSNRIAELTALITKVRQEKQRILEVTLTSISDNERNSTDYVDLPGAQRNQERKSDSSSSDSTQKKIPELPTSTGKMEQEHSTAPLEKHKQTGRSRDSGISMPSRPVTSLGHETEPEPPSFASSAPTITNTNTHSSSTQRKPRPPPPTLHRYSPQLPEEDVVHELSTIVEVDTPATSRINTSIPPPPQTDSQQPAGSRRHAAFPTFEEYIKELKLDLTIIDPEQSVRMEHEYNELIEALKDGKGKKAYNYDEFPTLTSYLKNLTGNDQSCHSPETIDDLLDCLRLATIIAKPFPSHREYLERVPNNSPTSPNNKFLDSESLENLTELQSVQSETESETLNIEAELKRRNILRQSFRSSSTKRDVLSTSISSKQRDKAKTSSQSTTYETGIEKLMTSTTTDSASEKFQRELLALGLRWHKSMRCKEKEAAALSSSTTESLPSHATHGKSKLSPRKKAAKKNEVTAECLSDSESSDHPLNLRDFLTRQLLKHASATSSCESSLSGESLRSQFFMAVLDSMTPSGSPRTNTNTASQQHGLERQKTSTPVQTSTLPSRVINEHSKSKEETQPQLFSGESNLSFVQNPEQKRSTKKKSCTWSCLGNTRKRQEREGEGQ